MEAYRGYIVLFMMLLFYTCSQYYVITLHDITLGLTIDIKRALIAIHSVFRLIMCLYASKTRVLSIKYSIYILKVSEPKVRLSVEIFCAQRRFAF